MGVDDTERGIAILQTLGNDAHRPDIKQFIEGEMLLLHFAPDAVNMLRTAINLSFYALFFHF